MKSISGLEPVYIHTILFPNIFELIFVIYQSKLSAKLNTSHLNSSEYVNCVLGLLIFKIFTEFIKAV